MNVEDLLFEKEEKEKKFIRCHEFPLPSTKPILFYQLLFWEMTAPSIYWDEMVIGKHTSNLVL